MMMRQSITVSYVISNTSGKKHLSNVSSMKYAVETVIHHQLQDTHIQVPVSVNHHQSQCCRWHEEPESVLRSHWMTGVKPASAQLLHNDNTVNHSIDTGITTQLHTLNKPKQWSSSCFDSGKRLTL